MNTPSKKRREKRAKRYGYMIGVKCPKCSQGFNYNIGTVDPSEVKCVHNWKYNPFRGPVGGIECTNENCGMFIDMRSFTHVLESRELVMSGELRVKP